jgi:hypothetical protein
LSRCNGGEEVVEGGNGLSELGRQQTKGRFGAKLTEIIEKQRNLQYELVYLFKAYLLII